MYKYKLRPVYGKLFFDFPDDPESNTFLKDFLEAIAFMNPVLESMADLWNNYEFVYYFKTDFGKFELSIDVWGFTISETNQEILLIIDSRLQVSPLFEIEEVRFEDYKKDTEE
jgi:hypothetical protein